MKTLFEIECFLSKHCPKTPLDAEFINAFINQRFKTPSKNHFKAVSGDLIPLDVSMFTRWVESGLAALKIIQGGDAGYIFYCLSDISPYDGTNSNLAKTLCCLSSVELQNDNWDALRTIDAACYCHSYYYNPEAPIPPEIERRFKLVLLKSNLEPRLNEAGNFELVPRYIPKSGSRVVFYNYSRSIQGVGVVRDVDLRTGDVELYCYFLYPPTDLSATSPNPAVGFSMHERGVVNLLDFIFEKAGEESTRSVLGNTVSCLRRLQKELEWDGKIWKDRISRIEPLNYRRKVGERYWYISDRLKVCQDVDKGTPLHNARYLAGNYFVTHMSAVKMLGNFNELIRDYLASPKWPDDVPGISDIQG